MPNNARQVLRWNAWEYVLLVLVVLAVAGGVGSYVNGVVIAQHSPKTIDLSNLGAAASVLGKSAQWTIYGDAAFGFAVLCFLLLCVVRALGHHSARSTQAIVAALQGAER